MCDSLLTSLIKGEKHREEGALNTPTLKEPEKEALRRRNAEYTDSADQAGTHHPFKIVRKGGANDL